MNITLDQYQRHHISSLRQLPAYHNLSDSDKQVIETVLVHNKDLFMQLGQDKDSYYYALNRQYYSRLMMPDIKINHHYVSANNGSGYSMVIDAYNLDSKQNVSMRIDLDDVVDYYNLIGFKIEEDNYGDYIFKVDGQEVCCSKYDFDQYVHGVYIDMLKGLMVSPSFFGVWEKADD